MSDQSHDRRDEGRTVAEAARILGITESAVRKRVERGKLAAEHAPDGRLVVYLDRVTTATNATRGQPRQSRDASEADERYTTSLEEQVSYLRSHLEQEREARTEERRRQDTVIAQLSRANEEQARTIRELEAPPSEATSGAAAEEPQRAEPRLATEEAQEAPQTQRPTEGVEHDASTLQEWSGDVQGRPRPQEGTQRPWWRRVFGG